MARLTPLIICALLAGVASESLLANPIRKVVGMLQDMQKTVEAEGEKEKDLFDKFMCYCNNGAGSLDASIQAASSQIEALTGKIATDAAQRSQSQQDIGQHKTDGAAAQTTIKESTAMLEKEAGEFAASSGEMKANIAAMTGALDALKKGLSASLLQTTVGQTLKSLLEHSPAVPDAERSTLLSFLETGEGGSDQIVGVVAQMKETMEADLKQTTADEVKQRRVLTRCRLPRPKKLPPHRRQWKKKLCVSVSSRFRWHKAKQTWRTPKVHLKRIRNLRRIWLPVAQRSQRSGTSGRSFAQRKFRLLVKPWRCSMAMMRLSCSRRHCLQHLLSCICRHPREHNNVVLHPSCAR